MLSVKRTNRNQPSHDAGNTCSNNSRFADPIEEILMTADADRLLERGCKRWRPRGCYGSRTAGWKTRMPSLSFSRQNSGRCKPIVIYPRTGAEAPNTTAFFLGFGVKKGKRGIFGKTSIVTRQLPAARFDNAEYKRQRLTS